VGLYGTNNVLETATQASAAPCGRRRPRTV